MTEARKEAERLMEKFGGYKYAILAVEEIINATSNFGHGGSIFDNFRTGGIVSTDLIPPCTYWDEVKTELENI